MEQTERVGRKHAAVARYKMLMRLLGVIYAAGALLFFFFPKEIFYLINVFPKVFKVTEAVPDQVEFFWLVLATSMMAMLSALSFLAAESPGVRGYALVHILSKVVSTAGFLYVFLNHQPYFAYLVGIITDLPLAVIVSWYTLRLPRGGEIESGETTGEITAEERLS